KEAKFRPGIMAAKCLISLRHLERFFGGRFNKPPKMWTKELQLQIARHLISRGWRNKAVVEELGFANESHFCHKFKTFYGVSPQTFAPSYRAPSTNARSTPASAVSTRKSFATNG